MSNANALACNSLVGGFRIDSVLGSGGFGITYRARNLGLDTDVALKEYFPASLARRQSDQTVVSRPEGEQGGYAWGREKFIQEARTLAQLKHPSIVGVNKFFTGNGTAYMALDFIEGPSLKAWLRARKGWPTQDELDALVLPLLDALEVVHNKGHLHRDVAPKNIMILPPLTPILIDFGAARQLVAHRSHTFAALLTPGYAPFEQYSAAVKDQGPWSDIYSLAATVYEAIGGRPPPEGSERVLDDRCIPATETGRGRYRRTFLEAVDWGLRPLPKERPQSVAIWRRALIDDPEAKTSILPAATATEKPRWGRHQ
jgi:serine/threonine protein kinase